MPVSVNNTFLTKLGHALQEWAEEVATSADPELVNMPLLWIIDRNELRGCPPSVCPATEAPLRLARWADALGLIPHHNPNTGMVSYVGRVDVWPVRLRSNAELVVPA
jgi:hypothetical protein